MDLLTERRVLDVSVFKNQVVIIWCCAFPCLCTDLWEEMPQTSTEALNCEIQYCVVVVFECHLFGVSFPFFFFFARPPVGLS